MHYTKEQISSPRFVEDTLRTTLWVAADWLEQADEITRLRKSNESLMGIRDKAVSDLLDVKEDEFKMQDAEITRLRELRRKECTQFAAIVGVGDSRDTRIVLANAKVKIDQIFKAFAAVLEQWETTDLSYSPTGYDSVEFAIEALRTAAGTKATPSDKADVPDDVVPCMGCGEPVTTCPEGIAFCDACAADNEDQPVDEANAK